ncbi:MAG TPA: type II secretion system secretin GspD [Polyangia bacterium]|nr:type II secretion system secretin GspD [Polyangia bacterium]
MNRSLVTLALAVWIAPSLSPSPSAARAATHAPALDEPPGEKEFVGCHKYPEAKKFRWTVRGEVGVPELVASLGEIGCQSILVGPQVAARADKVTIEVPDLLTASEVYRLFYSSLEVLGLTVEHSGGTLKIVDAGRAKEVSTPLAGGDATPGGDQFVTRLMRLEHARPQDLAEVFTRLRSKDGDVSVYAAGTALIVTDRGTVVRRMEELLRVLDVPRASERLWSLGTHGQSAGELSATLEKILQASRRTESADPKAAAPSGLGDGVAAVVPVEAARLVVVVASEDGFRRVQALAAKIDPPVAEEAGGQAHVIYLANTNAEDMAQTLQSVGLSSRVAAAPKPTGGGPMSGPPSVSASANALGLQGEVRIGADKVANAIVVFATSSDFAMVRDLIAKLDVPRRQVYVEARILDVLVDKTRNVGLVFHGTDSLAGGAATGIVASSAPGLNTVTLNAQTLSTALGGGGLLAGVIGQQLNVAGFSLPSIGVLLQALEHAKDVSVISRPHLLTMDNAKASLSVGQNFPYLNSSAAGTGGATLLSSYSQKDVSLKLELTPHLNESESVRLEINGEISDVPDGESLTNPGGPITNKRTIQTAIVVRDGDTVVLGGLQKDSESESVDKIPILGDIPLLGRLFQYRSKQRTKSDLLIVLTPYVIRGPEDLRRIYDRKSAEEREFAERFTAFRDEGAYDSHVDYHRKRGLLQEINLTAQSAEREAAALRKAERALRKPATDEEIH